VGSTEALYTANTNYTIAHVVGWLNGLSGWSATTLDNTWRASALCKGASAGQGFAATSVKGTTLTLYTNFDLHVDWYQQRFGIPTQNQIFMNNIATEMYSQNIFVAGNTPAYDLLFINNAFHQIATQDTIISSQLARVPMSHVVVVHNSMSNQGWSFRQDLGFNPDPYCLFACNAAYRMAWTGTADAQMVVKDNHLHAGGTAPPYATGTSFGGDVIGLYSAAQGGTFNPLGALLANLKPAVVAYDLVGVRRPAIAPAGAMA